VAFDRRSDMANFATGIGNPRFMKRKHQKQADPVIFVKIPQLQ